MQDASSRSGRRRLASRLALAAVCVMAVADLALSDAASLWLLRAADRSGIGGGGGVHRVAQDAIVAIAIFLECFLLAWPVTRMRRLRGVFRGFDEYQEARRERMGRGRRALSRAISAPYAALGRLGERIEAYGSRLAARSSSRVVARGARLLIDLGQVNAVGTTAVAMQETISRATPVTWRRIAVLASLITFSWIAMAELVRALYALAAHLGPPGAALHAALDAFGSGFDALTNIDLAAPLTTPVATVALGLLGAMLAVTGWNIARYHEQATSGTLPVG